MRYTIRQYENQDKKAIIEISMLAFTPIHASFKKILGKKIFDLVYPDWKKSHIKYLNSLCGGKDKKNILVVENTGIVVGFISFFLNAKKKTGELGLNAVHPSYQGKGIGKKLYRYVLKQMKDKGVELVEVSTGGDTSHHQAQRAYKKCGFIPLPLIKYYKAI